MANLVDSVAGRLTLTSTKSKVNVKGVVQVSGQSASQVAAGQSVYFIEPANRDDSATEDSITTDDSLIAVDAQGYMLQ